MSASVGSKSSARYYMGFFDRVKDFWKRQSRNFKVLLVGNLISMLGSTRALQLAGGGGRYTSIFIRSLGASYLEIGLLRSIGNLVRMVFSIPSGMLVDRIKRVKRLYMISGLLLTPISLVYTAARSWRVQFVTTVWGNITGTITLPAMNIMTIDSYHDKDQVAGLAIMRTLTSAVGLFTPLILAYFIYRFGGLDNAPDSLRITFVIQFLVGIIV